MSMRRYIREVARNRLRAMGYEAACKRGSFKHFWRKITGGDKKLSRAADVEMHSRERLNAAKVKAERLRMRRKAKRWI